MKYISTRGQIKPILFSDTVLMGLASDGGLVLPETIPDVSRFFDEWRRMDYRSLCAEIMSLYADLDTECLSGMISRSYASFREPDVVKTVRVGNRYIMELFHGPTLAFKDVALQFLGNLFEHILRERGGELNILAATSGDTGSAAIHGVRNRERIRIFVMHPHGRISRVQELQMTTVLDDNVHNIAVRGTFDDCQSIMKEVFQDLGFKSQYSLGSVNSINWARILAQIVYYFHSAFRVMDSSGSDAVSFAVPTGNFGDIFAGYIAFRMGLPVRRLILATNTNDILARFFSGGDYSCGTVAPTLSPSMDIQIASNFERYLFYLCGEDPRRLTSLMAAFSSERKLQLKGLPPDAVFAAGRCTDSDTLQTIKSVWKEHGYLLDPHSAVGWKVAGDCESDVPVICLATAHPSKFPEAVLKATGENLAHHPLIDELEGKEAKCEILGASVKELKAFIADAAK